MLIALCAVVRAQPAASVSDAQIIGSDPGVHVEDVELRSAVLWQSGHGFQSVDGAAPGYGKAGGEDMWVFEPYALFTIRQSATAVHEITVPVDVISAASPDAVDAMTAASRINESVDLEVRSTFKRSDVDTLTTRIGAHYEEPLSSGTLGAGWRRSLADDNATVGANAVVTVDGMDDRDHYGDYLGKTSRQTFNANVTASQLLSPTTVIDGSYGITGQHGRLGTVWNAVPVADGNTADEILPDSRVRQAATARIAQHVAATHSTVKAAYRYYRDDFGIRAHSIELAAYQYVVPWLYVRGSYRYHHQIGASFYTEVIPAIHDPLGLRTADSDLAPLGANEWSVSLSIVKDRVPKQLRGWSLAAEVLHYWRTNDLAITMVAMTIGRRL